MMLRRIIENARLVDDIREMLGMTRREAVMAAGLDVQEFVEGIAV